MGTRGSFSLSLLRVKGRGKRRGLLFDVQTFVARMPDRGEGGCHATTASSRRRLTFTSSKCTRQPRTRLRLGSRRCSMGLGFPSSRSCDLTGVPCPDPHQRQLSRKRPVPKAPSPLPAKSQDPPPDERARSLAVSSSIGVHTNFTYGAAFPGGVARRLVSLAVTAALP
ncbi:hypothetical protein BV20DRAFT_298902 [Pilatotrama ljubarskyi]|nr:hypothetical protein BV20DRAFT_298902 [Pilatotrama ljubarskyi]